MSKTVKEMMRERQDDLAKMMRLIELWEAIARDSREAIARLRLQGRDVLHLDEYALGRVDVFETCARDLRLALGLDPRPTAATPGESSHE